MRRLLLALLVFLAVPAIADDRLAGIGEMISNGRAREAREKLMAAQKAYEQEDDRTNGAVATLMLGMAEVALNDSRSARLHLEDAIGKFDVAGDSFGAWLALWMRTTLEAQGGHTDAAVKSAERALKYLAEAGKPDKPFSMASLQALAAVFGQQIDLFSSLGEAGAQLFKPILLMFAEAVTRDAYGAALIEADRLDEAERQLTQANSLQQMFGGVLDSSIAKHFGDLRRRQWRFREAHDEYEKALASVSALPRVGVLDQLVAVEILGKLAELEMLDGRLDDALASNDKALKIVRASHDASRIADALYDRAELLMRFSRFGQAETTANEGLQIATAAKNASDQAAALTQLGTMNMMRGRYGTAAKQLERAIALFHELHLPYLETSAWSILAEVYVAMDDGDNATEAIARGAERANQSGFTLGCDLLEAVAAGKAAMAGKGTAAAAQQALANALRTAEAEGLMIDSASQQQLLSILDSPSGAGGTVPASDVSVPMPNIASLSSMGEVRTLLALGRTTAARELLQKALGTNASEDLAASYEALIGVTYWKENNADEAIAHLLKAAKALEASIDDVRIEELLAGYLGSGRGVYFDMVVEQYVRQNRFDDAFAFAERARARAFLQVIGNTRIKSSHGAPEPLIREADALRLAIAAWEQQQRLSPTYNEKLDHDVQEGRDRYKALLTRIKASNPEYSSMVKVEPVAVADVQRDLDADTTMISYFLSPFASHAWVVDREHVQHVTLPFSRDDQQRALCWSQLLAATRSGTPKSSCSPPADGKELYTKLIEPVRPYIHTTRLLIVPHGVLHYVPFAALQNPKDDHYLIQDYPLTYAPSASSIAFLREKESPVEGRALVIGDPDTGTDRVRLPGAEREAAAIAKDLGVKAVTGKSATEDLLYGMAGKYDLLHIAAHGEYDAKHPLFSRIALAPAGTRDGFLEVHEILSDVDLTGVNLVVLSACSSGTGVRSGGDEITGLTRALLYAGTPGVIATLWDIGDEAAEALMKVFYARLLAGAAVSDALREAQCEMAKSERFHSPADWAAFSLTGNPRGRWKAN
jgi:CHAT domain-containing protein